jgi:hypothetical protein
VDEAMEAGLDGSDRLVVSTKMLRAELLHVLMLPDFQRADAIRE